MSARQQPHTMAAWASGTAALLLSLTIFAAPASSAPQVLAGGGSVVEGATIFTSPGYTNQFLDTFPGAGKGELAVQYPLPAGTLSGLQVHVETQNVPASGNLTVKVRINGANTKLKCSATSGGNCKTKKIKKVTVKNGDRISIVSSNNFVGAGFITYSYVMLFETP